MNESFRELACVANHELVQNNKSTWKEKIYLIYFFFLRKISWQPLKFQICKEKIYIRERKFDYDFIACLPVNIAKIKTTIKELQLLPIGHFYVIENSENIIPACWVPWFLKNLQKTLVALEIREAFKE